MITIDGSFGEGGGQILRTSLSLAALTGQKVRFINVRAKRKKPGLMRQHLACAKAVAEITGGTLDGAKLNALEFTFTPGTVRAGDYRFIIGSAGSAILLAQTVLPCLLCTDGVSHVTIEGGTHAANAPVFEYFDRVFLPCLHRMGADITAELKAIGFYPAGGGKIQLTIHPVKEWKIFELLEAGTRKKASLTAVSSGIPEKIGQDELHYCTDRLQNDGWRQDARMVKSIGPGNVLFATLEFEHITELFSVCGEYNIPRRDVGERVALMVKKYLRVQVPVGRFLADQLLLPMAIGAGGTFLTQAPSKHTETNIAVIRTFLKDVKIELGKVEKENYIIEVKK